MSRIRYVPSQPVTYWPVVALRTVDLTNQEQVVAFCTDVRSAQIVAVALNEDEKKERRSKKRRVANPSKGSR